MPIDPRKARVANLVCDQFALNRAGTRRQALVVAIKDGFLLDEMSNQSLLREEEGKTLYFPTLGTFALLGDRDPKLLAAHDGTTQVLRTFYNLYEEGRESANLSHNQLLEAAQKRFNNVDPDKFNLGLYLVDFPGLSAVQSYARDNDHVGFRFLTISERIMMSEDTEATWQRCVEISRGNAEQVESPRTLPQVASPPDEAGLSRAKAKQKGWVPNGWTLGKPIGEGGQGWTYKVKRSDEDDGEWFVFKRLKNAQRADRFKSEIKALRALNHPGILRIVEDDNHDGKPYYVAEYCQNGDLSKRNLTGSSTLEKLLLFRQVCAAVAAGHAYGIVHRDIKPSNVLVRSDGSLAVGDFGLCLHLDGEERFTLTEEAVGARNYMAPELEDGRRDDVTPAADVYSLGKLLYFLFTGKSFAREKHRDSTYDLTHPSQGEPERGIHFVYELLDKCILENPKARYSNAGEIVTAVDGAVRRIAMNAHVLNMNVRQPCLYCVEGEYRPMALAEMSQHRVTLVCWRCGNVQQFSPPFNGWNVWWMER